MEIDLFVRGFLATYFVLVAMIYHSKQKALLDRDGDDRVYYGPERSPQRFGRQVFNVFRLAILAAVVARVFVPEIDVWLGVFTPPAVDAVSLIGTLVMLVGTWVALYSHNYMGALWRSGTPSAMTEGVVPTALLQKGPFQRSRNPIFGGVLVIQIGFALALPSVFSLLCLAVGVAVLQRQTRIEEADLAERFGPSYHAYAARTPRWV